MASDADARPPEERRGGRPKARDMVMRALYESEITGDPADEVLAIAFGRLRLTEDGRAYAQRLLAAVSGHHRKIDNAVSKNLAHWDLGRLGAMERAILRLATAEIMYLRETPMKVVFDEALRLTHRYADEGAAGLVNGVLDPIGRRERKAEVHDAGSRRGPGSAG